MSTSIVIPATTATTAVTIQRPFQDPLGEFPTGEHELEAARGMFGIDGSGHAYFDPRGAVEGQHAALVANDQGELFLVTQDAAVRFELRRPDGHLMPGHHPIEHPRMRSSAADRDEPGHLFPGHLPARPRLSTSHQYREDGRVFGPVEPRIVETREYDRREHGGLLDAPERVMSREYDRQPDGRLLPATEPRTPNRRICRRADGRVMGAAKPRAPKRTYPTRERETTLTGRDRAR